MWHQAEVHIRTCSAARSAARLASRYSSALPPTHLELCLPRLHPLNLPHQPLRLLLQVLLHCRRRLGALPLGGQLAAGALLLRQDRRLLLRLLAQRLLQALQWRVEGRAVGGTDSSVNERRI